MSVLLIAGLVFLLIAFIISIRFSGDTNDGDMWIGAMMFIFFLIGIVLVLASGIWWIVTHFTYVGGAS